MISKTLQEMFDALESYNFECDGGHLINCIDYQNLKQLVIDLERDYNDVSSAHIAIMQENDVRDM